MRDKNLIKRWVDALRSNEYQQGQSRLKWSYTNKYCCLGVLCDLYDKTRWIDYGGTISCYDNISCSAYLPYYIRDTIDIDVNFEKRLTRFNDSGLSFGSIADYIEKNLL